MERFTRTNVANGIVTLLMLLSGITICAIMAAVVRRFDKYEDIYLPSTAGWTVIFAYLLPGMVGLLATFKKETKWYIAQSVMMVLNLVSTNVYFVYQVFPLIVMSLNNYGITCSGMDCPNFDAISRMVLLLVVIYILTSIASLSAFFTSITMGCSRRTKTVDRMQAGVSEHGCVRSYAHT